LKVAAAAAWRDETTLEMQWRFYETPHHDTVTINFDGDDVKVQFLNSITAGLGANQTLRPETRLVLKGRLTG
jgi:hypothetical protein